MIGKGMIALTLQKHKTFEVALKYKSLNSGKYYNL